jgi:serine/threonine protein kinase
MPLSLSSTQLGAAPSRPKRSPQSIDLPSTLPPNPPQTLGPWLLDSLIAEDSITRTYRARANSAGDDRPAAQVNYAVRVLRNELQNRATAIAQLRQEAFVGRCIAHRHVVSILAAHIHRPPYYVVMPLRQGMRVADYLARCGPLDVPMALWFGRQAAQALEAIHTAGYLHGNVKPANLFFSPDGHTTLVDLTCACRIDSDPMFGESALVGTPAYLAPEVLAGCRPDPRADLYALGISLFEMVSGRLPWSAGNLPQLAAVQRNGHFPSVRAFAPQIPSEVATLIGRLCARQPLRRPQTAEEVVESLLRLEIATLCARRCLA